VGSVAITIKNAAMVLQIPALAGSTSTLASETNESHAQFVRITAHGLKAMAGHRQHRVDQALLPLQPRVWAAKSFLLEYLMLAICINISQEITESSIQKVEEREISKSIERS